MYSTTCIHRGYKYHGNTCKPFIYWLPIRFTVETSHVN